MWFLLGGGGRVGGGVGVVWERGIKGDHIA